MATFKLHKDSWDTNVLSQAQMTLAVEVLNNLVTCCGMAGAHIGTGNFGNAGAHGGVLDRRFYSPKKERTFRAALGSGIERTVYTYLLDGYDMKEISEDQNVYRSAEGTGNVIIALEMPGPLDPLFPNDFTGHGKKGSRPDVRLALGQGTDGKYYEALFDLTSEVSVDHILKKAGNWLARANVPYIAEILWQNKDIMLGYEPMQT